MTAKKTTKKIIKKAIKTPTKKTKKATKKTSTKVLNIGSVDLFKALDLALKLSYKSGKFLLKKQEHVSRLKIKNKEAQGVATNADLESEHMIISGIKSKYPNHFILAEEAAFTEFDGEKSRMTFLKEKEWVWIIDPLDGTNNFLNGMDYFAVCISLVYRGEPVMGVVYRPTNDDCFYAIKKSGAFLENRKNRTKKALNQSKNLKPLKTSLLVTGFTSEKGELFDHEFSLFRHMMGKSRGVRRMGSAALDLCYVASGVFDCFWERGLAPWDVAAAGAICTEAGVKLSDYNGTAFHPFQETILAARSPLKEEVLNLFSMGL